jgi:hypothetical protein
VIHKKNRHTYRLVVTRIFYYDVEATSPREAWKAYLATSPEPIHDKIFRHVVIDDRWVVIDENGDEVD